MNDVITKPKRDVKKSDKSLYEIMHPKLDNATDKEPLNEEADWIVEVSFDNGEREYFQCVKKDDKRGFLVLKFVSDKSRATRFSKDDAKLKAYYCEWQTKHKNFIDDLPSGAIFKAIPLG